MGKPDIGETKHCPKCDLTKPVTEFWKRANRPGYDYRCNECRREAYRRYGKNRNVEERRAYMREYYHANVKSPEYHAHRKCRQYGLTVEQFEALNASQRGLCAICQRPSDNGKALHIDHCHDTGKVRGLLCHHCNLGLGKLGDTVEALRRAYEYLKAA